MSKECTCNFKFVDNDDYKEHLPCDGTLENRLNKALETIKKLKERVKQLEDSWC